MRSFISLQIKAPIIMKELLKHIIFDQREKDISQMIERDIDISLVNSPEVLVISGIRRCGKSVLLQQIRSPVSYTHLTLPTNREV